MNRRHRFAAALLAALTLVFAQLAVSAHACIFPGQPIMAEVASEHECCEEDVGAGGDMAGDNVCVEHCQYGETSFDGGQAAPGIVEVFGPALRVDSPDSAHLAERRATWLLATPAAPPPAAILFGVLRI